MKISIPNWQKYNERQDRKNYTWFRFQADFFFDQKLFDLTQQQKLLYIALLCLRCASSRDEFTISVNYLAVHLKSTEKNITKDISYLVDLAVICRHDTVIAQADADMKQASAVTTYERTDERTLRTNVRTNCAVALVEHWNSFVGLIKCKGTDKQLNKIGSLLKSKHSGIESQAIKDAMQNYADVLLSPESYWSHKWNLLEFLQRESAERFFPENFIPGNFIKAKAKDYWQEQAEAIERMTSEDTEEQRHTYALE